ncbi:putative light-harvesting complex-like protein OHP2 [Helianthus annuus]|nr:putative light-harvesting complex-like protein OHP2 [Helianthus annuus]
MDESGVESKLIDNGNQEKGGEKVEDEDDESKKLLLPNKGGLSKKKSGNKHRKVQWNDRNGYKLAEVLEYQPSDVSDSEDEDEDSCICNIM